MRIYFSFFLVINFFVSIPSFCQDTIAVKQLLEQGGLLMVKKPNEALTLFDKAYDLSRKLKYDSGIGVAACKLASLKSISDIQTSINFFKESIPYLLRSGNITLAGGALYTLAELHERKSNLDSSIYYCMEAVYLNERQQDHIEPAWLYAMISSLYLHIDQYNKSFMYAKKAIDGSDYRSYATLGCIAMSKAFKAMKRMDSALLYANIPLGKIQDIQPFYLCQVYNNLAEMQLLTNNVDSALYYINEVETLYKYKAAGLRDKLITFLLATDVWLAKKDISKSRFYLDKSISLIREKSYTIYLPDLYERLSNLHFRLGLYKEAFLYSDSATLTKELLSNAKNRFVIADLETKYQTAQKEKALSQKELQLHESRQYIGLSVAVAAIAILTAALVYVNYKNKRRRHQQQLQHLQQEKEIQLLQALMQGEEKERSRIAKDLHDGVAGMLAAAKMQLSSLSLKNHELTENKEFQQAIKLLNDSTHEVRLTSHNLMPEMLMRYGLNEALRRYCSNISNEYLLKVRYESWGHIKRYINTFELSVYRIVQELLNNVLKHSKATEAFVQLSVKEETLFIFIEDNGIGFQQPVPREGMGLQSLQARIKAMNGRFEVETSGNRGVSAYLEFATMGLEA
jgi:signal transduction histidine kinase